MKIQYLYSLFFDCVFKTTESKRIIGSITKHGSKHVRRMLAQVAPTNHLIYICYKIIELVLMVH
jgi:hypothetical protein